MGTTTTGVTLDTYAASLSKVPVHVNQEPARTFDAVSAAGPRIHAEIAKRYDPIDLEGMADLGDVVRRLPFSAFADLSFDQICKIYHGSRAMMDESVENAFKTDPRFRIVAKIRNSVWRWGYSRAAWNEIVDAYDGIRRFGLGLPDFEVRLDHTTGYNECGYSEHSRAFLDGVFGLLVHHKGEHVMTLGFSFARGRRLLLQQVQLKNRRGNRWLFKFPDRRLEFVIERFAAAFPRHRIHIVEGNDIVSKHLQSYENWQKELRAAEMKIRRQLESAQPSSWCNESDLAENLDKQRQAAERYAHLKGEADRLAAFYRDSGHYRQQQAYRANNVTHYAVAAGPGEHDIPIEADGPQPPSPGLRM